MQGKDLNFEQQRAVETSGVVLVVAGPGTGKTKTLTARIAYLLGLGIAAEEILALTFTKKAAEEMQARVAALVAKERVPKISTFHGLCYELLGREIAFVTEPQRLRVIKSLPRPVSLKHFSARELGLMISKAKNAIEQTDKDLTKLLNAYNDVLRQQDLRDFDDLLVNTYARLRHDTPSLPYKYILVDEFQDTNRLQYEILKCLLSGHNNLFVIGDPNQSIYGFRGASGGIFGQFKADFPGYTEITLTANYRSAPEIVNLSNAIFPEQPALEAHGSRKGQARAVQVLNEYGEADWVLRQIQTAIGGGDFLHSVSNDDRATHRTLADFAILYRSRSAALAMQKAIEASGLPYQIVGDGSPYEKSEVQMIIAILRATQTGETQELDNLSADNQRKAAQLLKNHTDLPPSELAEKVIATLGLEMGRELSQLLATLVRFETTKAAINYFDRIAQTAFYDPQADAITLLTIHASKGLEFPVVFLVGVQEGILPNKRADKAEEQRLFYVAATRAKERLEISYAKNRGGQPAQISSFLTDLPRDTLQHITDPDMQAQARRIVKRQTKRSQQSLF